MTRRDPVNLAMADALMAIFGMKRVEKPRKRQAKYRRRKT
jgi:hypothetical protein